MVDQAGRAVGNDDDQGNNGHQCHEADGGQDQRRRRYRAVIRFWDNAWAEFIPFLDHVVKTGQLICNTNSIESLNTRYRRAVKACGHVLRTSRAQVPLPDHPTNGRLAAMYAAHTSASRACTRLTDDI